MRLIKTRSILVALLVVNWTIAANADYPPPVQTGNNAFDASAPQRSFVRKHVAPFSISRAGKSIANGSSDGASDRLKLTRANKRDPNGTDSKKKSTPARALATVLSSLAIVLGLFFAVVWFTRRALPAAATSLPSEVVESLGRAPLSGRQQMQLVRVGNKLVLLSVTATGADTLTEITDPQEVDRISGLCQQNQPGSISSTFRQVLSQFGGETSDEVPSEFNETNNDLGLANFENSRRPGSFQATEI